MSRWRASAIHLLISVCIFSVFLCLTYFVWYPQPLFDAIGTWGLLQILTGVDVVLGPLLTLVLFKSGKKGLKFDLSVVALMQTAALAYGVYVVWIARPAFVVFAVDRFEVVQVNDAVVVPTALAQFKKASAWGPKYATIEKLSGPEMLDVTIEALIGGRDLSWRQEYYRPFESGLEQIKAHARPLRVLMGRDKSVDDLIHAFVTKSGGTADSWRYVPLVARGLDYVAIIDEQTGKPMAVLAMNPWVK